MSGVSVDFLDEILNEEKGKGRGGRGPGCSVAQFIATLLLEDAEKLNAAFKDPAYPAVALHRVLERVGCEVHRRTVERHKSGECGCRKVVLGE